VKLCSRQVFAHVDGFLIDSDLVQPKSLCSMLHAKWDQQRT
jgi:hypothetical protein